MLAVLQISLPSMRCIVGCYDVLKRTPVESLRYVSGPSKPNQWKWHNKAQADLVSVQADYRPFLNPA
jgi:hypothetical protein